MNVLTTASPDVSPLSNKSPINDEDNADASNAIEILKLDKQGLSNASLSTRLALRKNTESIVPIDSISSTGTLVRKRGRPRKDSIQSNDQSKSSSSRAKNSSRPNYYSRTSKFSKPLTLNDDINAIVENMSAIFKSKKSLTDPEVFDKSTLNFIEMSTGIVCSPLVAQKNIANIGMLKIQPLTHYGPYINTQRGFIVLIILNAEPGKLTFDSGHDNLGPSSCDSCHQLMVCPNDMFMLHNTSSSVEAEVLMIMCHSLGTDINHLRDIKYSYECL